MKIIKITLDICSLKTTVLNLRIVFLGIYLEKRRRYQLDECLLKLYYTHFSFKKINQ